MFERNPNIIEFDKCKDGYLYRIDARNSYLGIFVKEKEGFVIIRYKFGHTFLDMETHWDKDSHHGTATPLEELDFFEEIPKDYCMYPNVEQKELIDINNRMFKYLNQKFKQYPDERKW